VSFRIQDSLAWIARSLGIDRASSRGLDLDAPSTVLDTIQATVDAHGWSRVAARPGRFAVTSNGPTNSVPGPDVPDGETWFVYACGIRQSSGTLTIRLDIFDRRIPGGAPIATGAVSNNAYVVMPRPVLLVPGLILTGEAVTAIPLGQTFVIEALFFRLATGEYVPGGPYG